MDKFLLNNRHEFSCFFLSRELVQKNETELLAIKPKAIKQNFTFAIQGKSLSERKKVTENGKFRQSKTISC